MITLHWLYILAGLMFAAFAILSVTDPPTPGVSAMPLSGG